MISLTSSLLSWQHLSFWSSLSTLGTNFAKIFHIFSSSRIIVCTVPTRTSNCALIVSIDTWWSLSMKFFIWPINSGVLTSLLLPHLSSSLTDSLPSLNLLCYSKTDARFMQDAPKAVWSIPYVFVAFFPSLKQNHIHTAAMWGYGMYGCSPEDLPEAMNDREKWRERVRDIRAISTTWWWWWWLLHIVLLKCLHVQIGFLKFTSCDNQALVGCIPIAAVAVYLNLKSKKLVSHLIRCIAITYLIFNACTKKVW